VREGRGWVAGKKVGLGVGVGVCDEFGVGVCRCCRILFKLRKCEDTTSRAMFLYLDRRKDSRRPISRRPSLREVGRLEASLSSICLVKSASTTSLVALERRAPVFIRSIPP
jgi:hypothetical protein